MSRYVKTFKNKNGDKYENKNKKLMPFHIDDDERLEKFEIIWTKIEDLKDIELNALAVYADRDIKTRTRT